MTIRHNVEPPLSLKGCQSESQCCIDCGYNTNPGAPPRELAEFLMNRDGEVPVTLTRDSENYAVRNKVWKAAGMEPWGGCLCIPCLERRIGRTLRPKDFEYGYQLNSSELPSPQIAARRGGALSTSNLKLGAAQLRSLARSLIVARATRDEITDIVASATSEVGEWQQLGDIAERVAESCSADIRDHSIKMQRELNRQNKGE